MYILRRISEDHNALLQVVELVEKRIMKMNRHAKACNFKEAKPQKNTIEQDKLINKDEDNGKVMKMEETYKNNNKHIKDKQPKGKKYASTKEALKGISEELIQKHKSTSTYYWRCGQSNYHTTECYATTAKNGDSREKHTISSLYQRYRNDDDEESKDVKTAKTAVV
jgi:hypothetical protein